jgi:hypothetical protein
MDRQTLQNEIEKIISKYCDSTYDGTLNHAVFVGTPLKLSNELTNFIMWCVDNGKTPRSDL